MNRNRYRLIFDKRTGSLIPVAEFTTASKKNNAVYGDKGVYLSNTVTMTMFRGISAFVGADVGMVTDNGPVITPRDSATMRAPS